MKGVLRPVDELGRVVIPKELRKTLNLKDGVSRVEIIPTDEGLLLKNPIPCNDKPLSLAVDIINRELKIAKNLDKKITIGMERILELITAEIGRNEVNEEKDS